MTTPAPASQLVELNGGQLVVSGGRPVIVESAQVPDAPCVCRVLLTRRSFLRLTRYPGLRAGVWIVANDEPRAQLWEVRWPGDVKVTAYRPTRSGWISEDIFVFHEPPRDPVAYNFDHPPPGYPVQTYDCFARTWTSEDRSWEQRAATHVRREHRSEQLRAVDLAKLRRMTEDSSWARQKQLAAEAEAWAEGLRRKS